MTVHDVLICVSRMFLAPISGSERAELSCEEEVTVHCAYKRRVGLPQSFKGRVEGLMRADLLGKNHYFAGVRMVRANEFDVLVKANTVNHDEN